jgi:hypothetical protein
MNWESDTQSARRNIFPQPLVDTQLTSEERGKVGQNAAVQEECLQ